MPIVSRKECEWMFPLSGVNQREPSEYIYQIALDHLIPPGMLFHDCLVDIAKAFQAKPNSRRYCCYGSWIGTGVVWLMSPMKSKDEIKDNTSILSRTVLEDLYGQEKAEKILSDFDSTLISQKHARLKWVPELSFCHDRFSRSDSWPYEYLYYSVIKTNNSVDSQEFLDAFRKIKRTISESAKKSLKAWTVYKDVDTGFLHVYAPMREFGAMDDWLDLNDILKNAGLESESIDHIRASFYSAVDEIDTKIMTFVPSCDNSGCDFIEEDELESVESNSEEVVHV